MSKEARICQCEINDRCPKCDRRVKHEGYAATWEVHVERTRAYVRRHKRVKRLVERLNLMSYKYKHEQPKISLGTVERACFDYAGKSYPAAMAPTSVFQAAILEKAPGWKHHLEYSSLMRKRELDLLDRWYLLLELARTDRPITLYATPEQVAG